MSTGPTGAGCPPRFGNRRGSPRKSFPTMLASHLNHWKPVLMGPSIPNTSFGEHSFGADSTAGTRPSSGLEKTEQLSCRLQRSAGGMAKQTDEWTTERTEPRSPLKENAPGTSSSFRRQRGLLWCPHSSIQSTRFTRHPLCARSHSSVDGNLQNRQNSLPSGGLHSSGNPVRTRIISNYFLLSGKEQPTFFS